MTSWHMDNTVYLSHGQLNTWTKQYNDTSRTL